MDWLHLPPEGHCSPKSQISWWPRANDPCRPESNWLLYKIARAVSEYFVRLPTSRASNAEISSEPCSIYQQLRQESSPFWRVRERRAELLSTFCFRGFEAVKKKPLLGALSASATDVTLRPVYRRRFPGRRPTFLGVYMGEYMAAAH